MEGRKMSKFLQLRRPTTYSKVLATVPKPAGSLPGHGGLPLWDKLTLDQKLPANACPIHPPNFTRGPLGERPVYDRKAADCGWNNSSRCDEFHQRYLPLHDKHLEGFLHDRQIKKMLQQQKLINEKGEVICSLAEFNQFRSFLWNLHKYAIRQEYRKLDQAWWDEYRDKKAAIHVQKFYKFEDQVEQKRCKIGTIREEKRQNTLKAIQKYYVKLQKFQECREKVQQARKVDGRMRILRTRYNNRLLQTSNKSYCLRLKRRLQDEEHLHSRRLSVMKKRIRESKRIMKKERHKMLFLSAQQAEAQREKLLRSYLQHMRKNIQRRMERSAQLQEHFERQLTIRKTRNLTNKYDKRSKAALLRAMLKAWQSIRVRQVDLSRQLSRASVENAVNMAYVIHTTISPNVSSTQIIDTARQLMGDLANMPSEQLPLDQQTVQYTSDTLLKVLEQINEQVVRAGCYLIEKVAIKMRNRIESGERQQRHLTLCGPWNPRWKRFSLVSQSGSLRRVSIGNIQIVDEIQTEQENFKKSRHRPPTPVTSVTSLVEHIVDSEQDLSSSIEELEIPSVITACIEKRVLSNDHPLIHLTVRQRRFLETNLIKFQAIIHRNVETRALAAIDVMRLEIVGRKWRQPEAMISKQEIARETARCILMFPKEDKKYAKLLLDIINMLVEEICNELESILNAPSA